MNPRYVRARAILEDADLFDASFFGYSPREAELIDLQQRVFLEYAWEALENAGYDPERYPSLTGTFAGCGIMSYYMNNIMPKRELVAAVGELPIMIGNMGDYVAARVSYKLILGGPSVDAQSASLSILV